MGGFGDIDWTKAASNAYPAVNPPTVGAPTAGAPTAGIPMTGGLKRASK